MAPASRPPPSSRRRLPLAAVVSVAVIAGSAGLVAGVFGGVLGGADASQEHGDALPSSAAGSAATSAASVQPAAATAAEDLRRTAVVDAVERVAPAVVSITTQVPVDDPFARFRGAPSSRSGEGSGVVIESDGLVLTNAHVVARASRITATFADGAEYEADVLGIAEELDLAVLRLRDAADLTAVEVGRSADLMLGEPVIAIGNPLGLGHSVTTGVISATRRPLETDDRVYQDFLQTDASINPGNSGGPLLDVYGRLVGINTAIRADAQGIGFAIPVDRAIKVAHDLSRYGMVRSPWLGVDLEDVYLRDLDGGRGQLRTAARVTQVYAIQGAMGGGLSPGDVVVSIDGRDVQGRADLNAFLAAFEPGRTVTLTVRRSDGRAWSELDVQLAAQALPDEVVDAALERTLGVRVQADGTHRAGVPVTAVDPQGAFARAGGRVGDALVAVGGTSIQSASELRSAVAATKSAHRQTALVTIRRGRALSRVQLPL